jgi:hypothetical protein
VTRKQKAAAGLRTRRRLLTLGMIRSLQLVCPGALNKRLGFGAIGRAAHARRMSEVGQTRKSERVTVRSASTPTPDIVGKIIGGLVVRVLRGAGAPSFVAIIVSRMG